MDLTFHTPEGAFNYRVGAVIIHQGRLLAMKSEGGAGHYYLPGGRVRLHEEADAAIQRELQEELGAEVLIRRPLWVNQGFFALDDTGEKFHELCVYYLVELPADSPLWAEGARFERTEAGRRHTFDWLPFDQVKTAYFYPLFLKDRLDSLPQTLELLANYG